MGCGCSKSARKAAEERRERLNAQAKATAELRATQKAMRAATDEADRIALQAEARRIEAEMEALRA